MLAHLTALGLLYVALSLPQTGLNSGVLGHPGQILGEGGFVGVAFEDEVVETVFVTSVLVVLVDGFRSSPQIQGASVVVVNLCD